MNARSHDGLRAVVTGGGSGIGAAIVAALRDHGARVAVLDLEPGDATDRVFPVRCDVASDASVRTAIDAATEHLGGIDALVNNAGIGAVGTVEDGTDDDWRRLWDVNVVGMVRTARAALPHLRASGNASIVNLGSIGATTGLPQRALYSATKGAVAALTRAMAADHLQEGVRVNAIHPGTTDTPWVQRLLEQSADPAAERHALEARQPHGRLVTPDEVAGAVLYLTNPAARSITGIELAVDGGMRALRTRPRERDS